MCPPHAARPRRSVFTVARAIDGNLAAAESKKTRSALVEELRKSDPVLDKWCVDPGYDGN